MAVKTKRDPDDVARRLAKRDRFALIVRFDGAEAVAPVFVWSHERKCWIHTARQVADWRHRARECVNDLARDRQWGMGGRYTTAYAVGVYWKDDPRSGGEWVTTVQKFSR